MTDADKTYVNKFKLNNKIFVLNKDGKYYASDGNWANYIETLDSTNIIEYCKK